MKITAKHVTTSEIDLALPHYFRHQSGYYAIMGEQAAIAVCGTSILRYAFASSLAEYINDGDKYEQISEGRFLVEYTNAVSNIDNILTPVPCSKES